MSAKINLTAAQLAMLRECACYSLCKNYSGPGYIRLGGSGMSPIRRNESAVRTLENLGLLEGGSVIKASEAGYSYLATLIPPTPSPLLP